MRSESLAANNIVGQLPDDTIPGRTSPAQWAPGDVPCGSDKNDRGIHPCTPRGGGSPGRGDKRRAQGIVEMAFWWHHPIANRALLGRPVGLMTAAGADGGWK